MQGRIEGVTLRPDRLRARREELGLTQAQLAERTGLTQATISRLEKGASKGLYGDTQRRLEESLRTSWEWLCGADEAPPEPPQPRPTLGPQVVPIHPHAVPANLDAALGAAFDPDRHTVADLIAVRAALETVDLTGYTPSGLIRAAETWLDAAGTLRATSRPMNAVSLLAQTTINLLA